MTTTYAWLVLLFPLLGTVTIALGFRVLPGRSPGWIATGAVLLAFVAAVAMLVSLQGHAPAHRQIVSSL
jgi:NADH:ubiquinone oxidoreductase subunit 5 (subunit L)/multisubunit Na+/H+ antiporter MnhA subunit